MLLCCVGLLSLCESWLLFVMVDVFEFSKLLFVVGVGFVNHDSKFVSADEDWTSVFKFDD